MRRVARELLEVRLANRGNVTRSWRDAAITLVPARRRCASERRSRELLPGRLGVLAATYRGTREASSAFASACAARARERSGSVSESGAATDHGAAPPAPR